MLTRLSIHGFAIIDTLEIKFGPGFNVITGETGAGKSILIRALNLVLGGKASLDMIRSGSDNASVSGEFEVPSMHEALLCLGNLGIPFDVEKKHPIIIRRLISVKGKSQAWINDTPVTTQTLKDVGKTLIDIFGQHENQSLLESSKHLRYLEKFIKSKEVKGDYVKAYERVEGHLERLKELSELGLSQGKDEDFLRFRLKELRALGPSEEDYLNCKSLLDSSKSIVATREVLSRALEGLENGGPSAIVKEVAKILSRYPESPDREEIEALRQRVLSIVAELEDINFELSKKTESQNIDESAIENARERVFSYQDFFRKHGVKQAGELVEALKKLESDLDAMENFGARLHDELKALQCSSQELKNAGRNLRKEREKAMQGIRKAVETELTDLAMAGAQFDVEWTAVKRELPEFNGFPENLRTEWEKIRDELSRLGSSGSENAEFLLSANRGEVLLPLAKIASGGELSRIMLALKKALAADAETCVLVFDEIDTGISGRVADTVGKKMRTLSDGFQVLCISHLPQVAVYADRHYLVEKHKRGGRTETQIVFLSEEESAEEIARLLSGAKVTEASLKNAKHLKALAHGKRKIEKPNRVSQ